MVTIGAGGKFEQNHLAVELASAHPDIFATVGLHPHDAKHLDDAAASALARLSGNPRVVAIGETGLDYHYDNSPREVQRTALRRHIDLARARRLPLVIHLRDAYDDCVAILREERANEIGGAIHCFSGGPNEARLFLDLGFHLSFSGIVTFKTADAIRDAARLTPDDCLMVETDAPFLAPIPLRGKRNEPAYVLHTAACIAEVRGASLERVARTTSENTRRLFALDTHS